MTRTIKIKLNEKGSDEVERKDGVEALLHIWQHVSATDPPAYQPSSAKNRELILSGRVELPDEKFKKEILSSNLLASAMNALEKRTDNAK
jgi:hypothetical protein